MTRPQVGYFEVAIGARIFPYIAGGTVTCLFIPTFVMGYSIRPLTYNILGVYQGFLILVCLLIAHAVANAMIAHVSLRETDTFLREAGALGTAISMAVLLSLTMHKATNRSLYLFCAAILTIIVVYSTLKKSALSVSVIWILYVICEHKYAIRTKYAIIAIITVLIAVLLAGDDLKHNAMNTVSVYKSAGYEQVGRSALYVGAWRIAYDAFPFGSGMGSFASPASLLGGYSSVYIKYGLNHVFGLAPRDMKRGMGFIMDAFWAHIIGELGFLGSILFLILWTYPSVGAIRRRAWLKTSNGYASYFYIIAVCLVMSIENVASYTAESAPFIIAHAFIVGLSYKQLLADTMRMQHGIHIRGNNSVPIAQSTSQHNRRTLIKARLA